MTSIAFSYVGLFTGSGSDLRKAYERASAVKTAALATALFSFAAASYSLFYGNVLKCAAFALVTLLSCDQAIVASGISRNIPNFVQLKNKDFSVRHLQKIFQVLMRPTLLSKYILNLVLTRY